MRQEMDTIRKNEIKMIQEKKDAHIDSLIKKHDKKYSEIRAFYQDITNTNMDILRSLQDDLKA